VSSTLPDRERKSIEIWMKSLHSNPILELAKEKFLKRKIITTEVMRDGADKADLS
jgi:hypothetical protein